MIHSFDLEVIWLIYYREEKQETKVLVTQSCLTLCNPIAYSLPDSSVHGISQARILEWIAIPFFRGSSRSRDQTQTLVSCIGRWVLYHWALGKPQSPNFVGFYPQLSLETLFSCSFLVQATLISPLTTAVACKVRLSVFSFVFTLLKPTADQDQSSNSCLLAPA